MFNSDKISVRLNNLAKILEAIEKMNEDRNELSQITLSEFVRLATDKMAEDILK